MPKKISEAHRKAISKGQQRRWAKFQKNKAQSALAAAQPAKAHSPTMRGPIMPHGITVLRRHGKGRDILEGDAGEIRKAVKLYRDMLKRLK